jgi:hypothetical protein
LIQKSDILARNLKTPFQTMLQPMQSIFITIEIMIETMKKNHKKSDLRQLTKKAIAFLKKRVSNLELTELTKKIPIQATIKTPFFTLSGIPD